MRKILSTTFTEWNCSLKNYFVRSLDVVVKAFRKKGSQTTNPKLHSQLYYIRIVYYLQYLFSRLELHQQKILPDCIAWNWILWPRMNSIQRGKLVCNVVCSEQNCWNAIYSTLYNMLKQYIHVHASTFSFRSFFSMYYSIATFHKSTRYCFWNELRDEASFFSIAKIQMATLNAALNSFW